MFNKNDPLIGAVTKIMEENARRRQVEIDLCEELGIVSRRQLPREHLANYDALLEQRLGEGREEYKEKAEKSLKNNFGKKDDKAAHTVSKRLDGLARADRLDAKKPQLKGNQHKIDANKNGKVDAHDFKLLRGKKEMQEDLDIDAVMEEIRANIGEEAFNALMTEQGATPFSMFNRAVGAVSSAVRPTKTPAPNEVNSGRPGPSAPGPSTFREKGQEKNPDQGTYRAARQQAVFQKSSTTPRPELSPARQQAKTDAANAEAKSNAQDGLSAPSGTASVKKPSVPTPDLSTRSGDEITNQVKTAASSQLSKDTGSNEMDMAKSVAASKPAPTPPPRPANLGGNRPAPGATPASATSATPRPSDLQPNRLAQNGETAIKNMDRNIEKSGGN